MGRSSLPYFWSPALFLDYPLALPYKIDGHILINPTSIHCLLKFCLKMASNYDFATFYKKWTRHSSIVCSFYLKCENFKRMQFLEGFWELDVVTWQMVLSDTGAEAQPCPDNRVCSILPTFHAQHSTMTTVVKNLVMKWKESYAMIRAARWY